MTGVTLIDAQGTTRSIELGEAPVFSRPTGPLRSRVAYAAAHVIPKRWAENVPGAPADIDWDATLAFRRHVHSWGLGVADAMDTAQRNMGLDAAATRELITRSAAEARAVGGSVVAGYFGDADTVLRIIEAAGDKVAGIKMSLLDAEAEVALRRRLPAGVRMFTGDDFNYVRLIEGDGEGDGDAHSDALLGAFASL